MFSLVAESCPLWKKGIRGRKFSLVSSPSYSEQMERDLVAQSLVCFENLKQSKPLIIMSVFLSMLETKPRVVNVLNP